MKFLFLVSNNEAEYEALLAGLRMANSLKLTRILVRIDSQVVIGHVTKIFEAKEDNIPKYLLCIQQMLSNFSNVQFEKVPREQNTKADILSKVSAGRAFRDFCEELGIEQHFISVGYLQTNGATKVTNRTILQGLKKRPDEMKGWWLDELPTFYELHYLTKYDNKIEN
ncbi:hypothetical protein M9H77_20753 [Catharanthus roseus]|uniref:Uncharacterized protein n=1 Tax=Catharanthus roseus TaxID=4058 RepID=A0ACC0AMD6_CATRO|nr:hypothetical protein M9H77_20753 [Catharanthus roseus]